MRKKIERMCLQALPFKEPRNPHLLMRLVNDKSVEDDILTSHEVQELFSIDGTVLVEYVRRGLTRFPIHSKNNPRYILCSFYRLSDIRSFIDQRKQTWDAYLQESTLCYE